MKEISVEKAGMILVLILGAGLLIAQPAPGLTGPAGNGQVILNAVNAKSDHVLPLDVAKSIVEGREGFFLVDVREPWEFDDYHVPGAVNIPLGQLMSGAARGQLPRDKEIVLYSAGGTHAAQAWVILAQSGYNAKNMLDGMEGWWRDVMTPVSVKTSEMVEGPKEYQSSKAIREYFGAGGSGAVAPPSVSAPPSVAKPSAPSQPAPASPGGGVKKRGGGC